MSQSNRARHTQAVPAVSSRPTEPVSDDHGRPLTTNAAAAAWYRIAQRSLVPDDGPNAPLRKALQADPTFAVAVCDLCTLVDGTPNVEPARPSTIWERHHCEVVAAAKRDVGRASGMLREHLADAGCDPLALHIVATALRAAARFADADALRELAPCCHVTPDG